MSDGIMIVSVVGFVFHFYFPNFLQITLSFFYIQNSKYNKEE